MTSKWMALTRMDVPAGPPPTTASLYGHPIEPGGSSRGDEDKERELTVQFSFLSVEVMALEKYYFFGLNSSLTSPCHLDELKESK